jgi:predicted MPP superfamily phosphohydrolase
MVQISKNMTTKLTRRDFIKYGVRLSILSILGLGYAGRTNLTIEHHPIIFSNLPRAFKDYRIVHISDIHASFWVNSKYLNHVVKRINAIKKDLLVITGDIITGSVNDFFKRWLPNNSNKYITTVIEAFGKLEKGPKLAVLGNHDQWDGKKTEQRLVDELERIGIGVLRNNPRIISRGKDRITVIGTDDVWFSCNLQQAFKGVSPDNFTVLLSHSPDIRENLESHNKVDLTLCGHTHGGQIAIPYLSPYYLPIKRPTRYMAGLVQEPYGYTYVNRGIGTLVFPFRINASPEITVLTLKQV